MPILVARGELELITHTNLALENTNIYVQQHQCATDARSRRYLEKDNNQFENEPQGSSTGCQSTPDSLLSTRCDRSRLSDRHGLANKCKPDGERCVSTLHLDQSSLSKDLGQDLNPCQELPSKHFELEIWQTSNCARSPALTKPTLSRHEFLSSRRISNTR